ncbi:hypothetical protein EV697_10323 [Bisgaardia hudsonensis]|uniref:UPF0434 protein EV697_10323 n=1 Tax=Bisgaardia hudsonensis TaxID=109472 RepID=A0A4R2N034_9PAST|nr:Trm112 family protein [Bisgaardia hudsonensis]QLB13320.1 hypothetical protein A6A11_06735 [Bisgaardia hudsonensis]TCP12720.1 hypothetical protein EV697_10323 [Bisgaardia hudsonensis]
MNNRLLKLIACPKCQGQLMYDEDKNQLICEQDNLAYSIQNGIPVLLSNKASTLDQTSES